MSILSSNCKLSKSSPMSKSSSSCNGSRGSAFGVGCSGCGRCLVWGGDACVGIIGVPTASVFIICSDVIGDGLIGGIKRVLTGELSKKGKINLFKMF